MMRSVTGCWAGDTSNVVATVPTSNSLYILLCLFIRTCFVILDVRSLAVASRSRQSEKQQIADELGLSNMHIWEGVSVREEQWRRVTDKMITIEQA